MWLRVVNRFVGFIGFACVFNCFIELTGAETFGKSICNKDSEYSLYA